MGVGDQLRHTNKGRLSYERNTSSDKLKEFLTSCSSPPEIHISPKFSESLKPRLKEKYVSDQDEKANTGKVTLLLESPTCSGKYSPPRETSNKSDSSVNSDVRVEKSCVTSPEFIKSRLAIQKYETELESRTRKLVLQKKQEFEEHKARIEQDAERRIVGIEQRTSFESRTKVQNIEHRYKSQEAEIDAVHKRLRETHAHRKQIHESQIQEAEHAKRKLQQEKNEQKDRKERQSKLAESASQLRHLSAKITEDYSACRYSSHVSEAAQLSMAQMKTLVANMNNIVSQCEQSGDVQGEHFQQCANILDLATDLYKHVRTELELAEKAGEEAHLEAKRLAKQKEDEAKKAELPTPIAASTPVPVKPVIEPAVKVTSSSLDLMAVKRYLDLQGRLTSVEESVHVLSSTAQLKKLKFDIQKAVNTPINAISGVSGDHLRDKLKRLLSLLAGQTVDISGRTVTLKQHPSAGIFCKNLIAKMVVKKGEEQVSSSYESAFAIAMVTVGLWREQPDLGDLFVGHFYAACPYLAPFYPPKLEGQTDEQYFRSRGYQYEDGQVEKQEKFLKRMSGIMRLYFSIIVSSPPRGEHPHGVQHAWAWIARVLNLEPEPDITSTMIFDFLQVAGFALLREYKKQFLKLLRTLCKDMLPKLKDVSSPAGRGGLSRLQVLLENSVKNHGHFSPPEGYLDQRFWLS